VRDSRVCVKTCFCHLTVVWRPLAEERLAISTQCIHRWKVHLVGYNSVADVRFCLFRLAVVASETCKMSRNSKRIWPYSSSRPSKVIDLGVSGKPMWLHIVIVTLAVSATVLPFSRYSRLKIKQLILPNPPLFDAPALGNLTGAI